MTASSASAEGLLGLDGCSDEPHSQVFGQWADPLSYRLAPGGAFEAGDSAWTMSGGAKTVAGNESFYIHDAADTRSASLPAGSSITSPDTCVSLGDPAMRFMARSTGSALGILRVDAIYRTGTGALDVLPIGVVTGLGSSWSPSLPMALTVGTLPSTGRSSIDLKLRFSVTGLGGSFQVDDVYVDPYGRR